MKKLLTVLVVLGLLGVANVWADSSTQDVTLTVTPIVTALFSISPNSYAYGNLDLAISSVSVSGALCPVINNTGDSGLTFEKTVNADDDWVIATSTTTTDNFVLWAMTNTSRPNIGDFTVGNTHRFETTLGTYNNLTNSAGTQVSLIPDATADLYFRIDTPSKVTDGNQVSIVVRIRGTTQ